MKKLSLVPFIILIYFFVFQVFAVAQVYNTPLTMQGLNNTTIPSVVARAMGGVTLGIKNDPSTMFSNPAGLQSLEGIQISVSGLQQNKRAEQIQHWVPLLYYPNFSLLMQGLTRNIPDPDTIRNFPPNAGDSVQRPFDNFEPNWKQSKNKLLPIQFSIGVPFSVEGINFSVGFGIVQYANLNYYYENNNVLSPDIGSFRSGVLILPTNNDIENSKLVYWYRTVRERTGAINGYGGAVAAALTEKLSLGFSTLFLDGKADDSESIISRGEMRMFRDYFGLYRYQQDTIKTGTSNFKGYEHTISANYRSANISFGFAVKPPTIIKRDYKSVVRIDTVGVLMNSLEVNSSDKITLPWRGTLGIGIALRNNFTVTADYEYLTYSSAKYSQDTITSKPWLDCSTFRIGLEYLPISQLALRVGYWTQVGIFEPEGNYNPGDPVSSDGYSAGLGYRINNIHINFAYEYLKIRYEDKWATNVNFNKNITHNFIIGTSYVLPLSIR